MDHRPSINEVNMTESSNGIQKMPPNFHQGGSRIKKPPEAVQVTKLNKVEETCSHTLQNISNKLGPFLSTIQCSVAHTSKRTEKLIQKGGRRAHKTMQRVYTSVTSISQRLRRSTRRRYMLENTPTNTPTVTPSRVSSRITPGKLYSPFDLNTPRTPNSYIRDSKRKHNSRARRNVFGK